MTGLGITEAKQEVVAFLGPKASYTHQATLTHFSSSQYTLQPLTTIEDVFAAVQSGQVSHGVVPFENSSNGSVVFTLDLFADSQGRYPDILVSGEAYLAVQHCLLGAAPTAQESQATEKNQATENQAPTPPATDASAKDAALRAVKKESETEDAALRSGQVTPTQAAPSPGCARVAPTRDLKHINKLYSHPQAWGQCKLFLAAYLKGVERQDVSSTSKAAELVKQDGTGRSAAISSMIAARLNGLEVLGEGIEDLEGNCTRFFVVRKRRGGGFEGEGSMLEERDVEMEMAMYKTLVSFTVEHGEAGALADCLAVFKKYDLNLTSINTRPSGEAAWHYIFFVELMGWKRAEGEGGAVNDALQELTKVAKSWRWLGSWENALLKP